ncbi:carbohydrate esterase family 1 protein [Plenodomus tracheiphilus IPT5]|uniref:Feruloyl esterase C n=1 Tax=Plenodomus tracheiphilus IPT5 TaxID=1408161 RepID=A0A6A7BBH0_9PLEO|nr:carbohydrate esterase family 1 protein [Plenodomus tracheiphilus IPT5]
MFHLTSLTTLTILYLYLSTFVHAGTTGCEKTPTLTNGPQTMTINGKQRHWILRIPSNYNATHPYRFIFGLHWLSGTMNSVDSGAAPYYGLQSLAQNSTIFVAPDGLNNGWANQNGEDITFLNAIRKQVEDDLCVNEKLRFSLGFSYGAAMSYSLACSAGKEFRAIAVLSGALLSGCAGGNDPVAFYGQHGVKDSVLPIESGRQIRDKFVKLNGCRPKTALEPVKGSRRRVTTVYEGCEYPTQFTAFDGDHVALPDDAGNDVGLNSFTPVEVWRFFSQFS